MNSCRKIGGYFFLFFSIALIVQAKPVIIESSIAPLIASFIPAPKKKTINAAITIRMIEIIIPSSSPICNFILHLKDVVILLCLVTVWYLLANIWLLSSANVISTIDCFLSYIEHADMSHDKC